MVFILLKLQTIKMVKKDIFFAIKKQKKLLIKMRIYTNYLGFLSNY